MTGTQILAAFESIGAVVRLTPAGIVDVQSPDVPEFERLCAEVKANRAEVVEELKRHAAPAHPCVSCGQPADASTLYCPACWTRRQERGRVLPFYPTRAARTAASLAERFCPACGFSFWRVSSRGDARCYACALLAEGKPLRCARCGGEGWQRDEHGRRTCATCAGGDTRVAAPLEIVAPGRTSGEFPAPEGGAA